MYRALVLGIGQQPWLSGQIRRFGLEWGASRFVAGETLNDALEVVAAINRDGLAATVDYLGEAAPEAAVAEAARDAYLELLDALAERGLDAGISVKPSLMGLGLDADLARANLDALLDRARERDRILCLDMEEARYTDGTLALYRALADRDPGRVGVVLQAYLRRTPADLTALSDRPRNLRIVKGAYQEARELVLPDKASVDDAFVELVTRALEAGHRVAVATHDERTIGRVLRRIRKLGAAPDRYEFQMLYGVKYAALKDLAREGHRCRVYVPYGQDWYAYFLRRLAERPANLLFAGRAILGG
ncbi:Proline dehydrogenase 1 [Candidatus Hydrogenisulfobacillus filiaventi]|uniref:proline dehydrogenase n=1 Tax=Candidatus Hydrogenisulfobacillus filiaventi TaxID=2707344 RepID=A0A6F8ZIV2_9FIRM|nr:proline dehydrogenase family protein [Bacillota bacterium]CAB1129917.1 Proline dehydrogenase 1 [Candidatus Hydrogenisulfobacillus filiaventi]